MATVPRLQRVVLLLGHVLINARGVVAGCGCLFSHMEYRKQSNASVENGEGHGWPGLEIGDVMTTSREADSLVIVQINDKSLWTS